MRALAWLLVLGCALAPRASAQPLPDLGGTAEGALPQREERRIGENLVRDIRQRDPTYLDDPEVSEYLNVVGHRLTAVAHGARQDFEFFLLRDHTINAFALPGGFIGVHTGLITQSESESELASVLAHEIGHVTQRHIARMFGTQKQIEMPAMIALAAALLLGASRPDLAAGAAAAVQAGAVQTQLNYSRDFEREADRVGLQTLAAAGYDVRAMPAFFERLQRSTRAVDDGSVPGWLRTHPVTSERIADTQNRVAALPYRQHLDAVEFHLARAKLRAEALAPRDAVESFAAALREKRYASEAAARYGLTHALALARRPAEAAAELARLRATGAASPMIEMLAARVAQARGDAAGALAILGAARGRYPHWRSLTYAYVAALIEAGQDQPALEALAEPLRLQPGDARLHALQARSYAGLGKRLLQHQAQAEVYRLQGALPAAIEQLQLARDAGDGDFYQLSVIDARLRELRARHAQETREGGRR